MKKETNASFDLKKETNASFDWNEHIEKSKKYIYSIHSSCQNIESIIALKNQIYYTYLLVCTTFFISIWCSHKIYS